MSTSMWLVWWSLALDHVKAAEAARQKLVDAVVAGGNPDWALPLRREMESSLQAVSCAAFACEALVIVWTDLVIDTRTRSSWYNKPRRRSIGARMGEVFKRVYGPKIGAELDDSWTPLFRLRDNVVHHLEVFADPGDHPSGIGGVSAMAQQFTAEQARSAVDLLARLTAEANRTTTNKQVLAWLADRRHVLDPLEAGERPQ
ncbi:hypothetical protein [Marmoricola sp. URHA0025 HA25]